ncbi:MAG: heme-dependent oxidative N-demethylase family protein, partial [Alphaproteobacteria bacterium]
VAASLCFPSRWRLAEKLGRPLAEIHGPVPDYGKALAAPVDRFFGALGEGRIVERWNWTIHDRPDLFQPQSPRRHAVPPERFADGLFLRNERQTLRRLPRSRAILFAIDTRVTRLGDVPPADARNLAAAIRHLPDGELAYKGIAAIAAPLAEWLAAR